jgi:hypothetical protein
VFWAEKDLKEAYVQVFAVDLNVGYINVTGVIKTGAPINRYESIYRSGYYQRIVKNGVDYIGIAGYMKFVIVSFDGVSLKVNPVAPLIFSSVVAFEDVFMVGSSDGAFKFTFQNYTTDGELLSNFTLQLVHNMWQYPKLGYNQIYWAFDKNFTVLGFDGAEIYALGSRDIIIYTHLFAAPTEYVAVTTNNIVIRFDNGNFSTTIHRLFEKQCSYFSIDCRSNWITSLCYDSLDGDKSLLFYSDGTIGQIKALSYPRNIPLNVGRLSSTVMALSTLSTNNMSIWLYDVVPVNQVALRFIYSLRVLKYIPIYYKITNEELFAHNTLNFPELIWSIDEKGELNLYSMYVTILTCNIFLTFRIAISLDLD